MTNTLPSFQGPHPSSYSHQSFGQQYPVHQASSGMPYHMQQSAQFAGQIVGMNAVYGLQFPQQYAGVYPSPHITQSRGYNTHNQASASGVPQQQLYQNHYFQNPVQQYDTAYRQQHLHPHRAAITQLPAQPPNQPYRPDIAPLPLESQSGSGTGIGVAQERRLGQSISGSELLSISSARHTQPGE